MDDYSHIPFVDGGRDEHGVDCWGLVCLVSRDEFGVELPDYPGAGLSRGRISAKTLLGDVRQRRDEDFHPVEKPQPGDVVLLQPSGRPILVGIVVSVRPRLKMMHAERGIGVAVEDLNSPLWRHRIEGYYRFDDSF